MLWEQAEESGTWKGSQNGRGRSKGWQAQPGVVFWLRNRCQCEEEGSFGLYGRQGEQ